MPITSNERYDQIVYDLQMVARANLIFGLHVHVAIEDLETRIQVMNAARYFLPHVFALSVNSPFWCGQNTGWKSYRAKVFERFPRTGIPDSFRSNSEYEEYVQLLIRTNCMDNAKKIWWDVRPHPFFPTLEYRICDVPMRVEETICIAALFQAITYKLWTLYRRNMGWRLYRRMLLNENKARAARFGIQGKLIDFLGINSIRVAHHHAGIERFPLSQPIRRKRTCRIFTEAEQFPIGRDPAFIV